MRTSVLICAAALLFIACLDDGEVDVYLVKSSDLSKDPLAPALVSHVRVRVTGPGMKPRERISQYTAGGSCSVPKIPQGQDRVITVEGLEAEDGIAMSRGRSLPLDIGGGNQSVTLFIARVGRFSDAPHNGLRFSRFGHAAVSDETGFIFVVGGASEGTPERPESFRRAPSVIDPTSVAVRALHCGNGCRMTPRAFGIPVPVAEGFLLTGGIGEDGGLVDGVELVDTTEETVQSYVIDLVNRVHAASVVFNQVTVIAGGRTEDGVSDLVEIVDRMGRVERSALPAGRYGMAAGGAEEKAIFFGGFDEDGVISGDAFLFDVNDNRVSRLDTSLSPRAHAAAVSLLDGRVLILGGLTPDGRASGEVDLFDPSIETLCPVGRLSIPRWHHTAVLLPDGRVLVVGGLTGAYPGQPSKEARILDSRYTKVAVDCQETDQMPLPEGVEQTGSSTYLSQAKVMSNGSVALIGGLDGNHEAVKQIEVYVPPE